METSDGPDETAAEPQGVSIRDRVTRALAMRILSGGYRQGTALPTEAELGAEFGVSRTALREAARTLAAKGLIETRQRAGTRVRISDDWNRLDADVLAWMGEVEPDFEFVKGLTEARTIIEPAAAELAALRATARDLAVIEAAYEAMCAADNADLEACADADVRFHVGILKASHNPVLANLGNVIAAALRNSFRLTTSASTNFSTTLDAHGGVLEAIRMRRSADARTRMQALLGIASEDILRISEAGVLAPRLRSTVAAE
ncbi:MAG TPA: FadR/GntR family transcriptional regulator [Bauldia sp.]|nr:FadR/GntR family transcriptional regulator [Bauldia sp.]